MSTATYALSVINSDDQEIVYELFHSKDNAETEMNRLIQDSEEGTLLSVIHEGNLVSTMYVSGEPQ